MRLLLKVPYKEKDEVKALGAKWSSKEKMWYINIPVKDYAKYEKWIFNGDDDVTIAVDTIYIVEGERICWKCGRNTKVVGLGVGKHIIINREDDLNVALKDNCFVDKNEIHLSWVPSESSIPPRLLSYLKKHYSVKTGDTTIGGKCFSNYCKSCGAIQGNFYLFEEPDSPLSSQVSGDELIDRMSSLRIKRIMIQDSLLLDWDIFYCSNDYAYCKYGQIEKVKLNET